MEFFKRIFIWMFCIALGLAGLFVLFAPYVHELRLVGSATGAISGYRITGALWAEGFAGAMSAVLQILVMITAGGILLIGVIGMLCEFLFNPIPEIKKGGVILAVSYTALNLILAGFLIALCISTRGQAYYYKMGYGVFIALAIGLIISVLLLVLIRVLKDESVWSSRRVVTQTNLHGTGELPVTLIQQPAPMTLVSYGQIPQSVSYGQIPQSTSYGQIPQSASYGQIPQSASYGQIPQSASYGQAPISYIVPSSAPTTAQVALPPDASLGKKTEKGHKLDSTVSFRFIEGMNEADTRAAVNDLSVKANRGDADAQFRLGICYQNGTGVPQNLRTAADWQKKASAQGHTQAKFVLGEYYIEGKGVPKTIVEGITLLKESANRGFVGAQMRLGNYYENGEYLPRDYEKAVQWYTRAAEQGNAFSIQALKSFKKGADGKWMKR